MGIQHARSASEEDKGDGKRMVEKVNENDEELNDWKEHMRALLAYSRQNVDQPTTTGNGEEIKMVNIWG